MRGSREQREASRGADVLHARSLAREAIPFIPQGVFRHARRIVASSRSASPFFRNFLQIPAPLSRLCVNVVFPRTRIQPEGGSRDPSPQLILGAKHAGSPKSSCEPSGRSGPPPCACTSVLCASCVCVCPSVLTCTLVFLGLQTRRQPVLLANGLYGKTSTCKSQTMGSAHAHSGKGFALFNRDTSPIFQLKKNRK